MTLSKEDAKWYEEILSVLVFTVSIIQSIFATQCLDNGIPRYHQKYYRKYILIKAQYVFFNILDKNIWSLSESV